MFPSLGGEGRGRAGTARVPVSLAVRHWSGGCVLLFPLKQKIENISKLSAGTLAPGGMSAQRRAEGTACSQPVPCRNQPGSDQSAFSGQLSQLVSSEQLCHSAGGSLSQVVCMSVCPSCGVREGPVLLAACKKSSRQEKRV